MGHEFNSQRTQLHAAFIRAGSRSRENLGSDALTVERLSSQSRAFASVDSTGEWALAIVTEPASADTPALRLASLRVDYGVECDLVLEDAQERASVSIVQCTSSDVAIRDLFVSFCIELLAALPERVSQLELANRLNGWVSLFWRLTSPPRIEVIGLIGELIAIRAAPNTSAWVRAWHSTSTDSFDFAFVSPYRLVEVKATGGSNRAHSISLAQSTIAADSKAYILSVLVDLRLTGMLVGDLTREIADSLENEEDRRHFWGVLTETCGSSLPEFMSQRFAREHSMGSLTAYDASSIPKPVVQLPLPAGVSDVRFRADLSSTEPSDLNSLLDWP